MTAPESVPTIADMVAEAATTDPAPWPFTWAPPVRALAGQELLTAQHEVAAAAMLGQEAA